MKTTSTKRRKPPVDSSPSKPQRKRRRNQPRLSDAPVRSEELFRRIDISPNDLFDRLGRDGIEIIVEGLIALLNHLDGDCEDEGATGCDDREGDELQHGGDEHDGAEPDADGEASLGWGLNGEKASASDRELAAQPSAKTMRKKRRHFNAGRDYRPNRDGMHVDTWDSVRIGPRRIRNLSETQANLLESRIDRREVRI
jgi:hypothetical protein